MLIKIFQTGSHVGCGATTDTVDNKVTEARSDKVLSEIDYDTNKDYEGILQYLPEVPPKFHRVDIYCKY
jgi:hypothetical protein